MQHKNADTFVLLENFITDFWDSNGVSPTTKEIADGTGLSTATVCRYLQQMRKDGSAVRYGHRGVRTSKQIHSDEMLTVPLLGEVACGLPTLAVENIVEYIKLPVSLFGKGNFYLLRAKGDSIIEVGVEDGDLVLIRQQSCADPGQIVVALVGEEATLKRYYPEPEKHRVRLHPENREMNDIYVSDCVIQGVAVKVLKDLI